MSVDGVRVDGKIACANEGRGGGAAPDDPFIMGRLLIDIVLCYTSTARRPSALGTPPSKLRVAKQILQ